MAAIVNKFSGSCKTCSTRVPAGKGIARKNQGKGWSVFCTEHAGETHGARNPWKAAHKTAALDYAETPYEASRELALVDHEFSNTDDMAEPCETPGCGGTMHYRATVGAPQCPDCRAMVVYKWTGVGTDFERKVIAGNR